MSQLPSNWSKVRYSDFSPESYIGDRLYAGVCTLLFVILPLFLIAGLRLISSGSFSYESNQSSITINPGFNIQNAPPAWLTFLFCVMWVFVWQGRRWAFVVNLIVCIYFAIDCMVTKTRMPVFELISIVYMSLRLSDSLGPALKRSSEAKTI